MQVLTVGKERQVTFSLGAHHDAVQKAVSNLAARSAARRLWEKDPSLWSRDAGVQSQISNSLGWLSVIGLMKEKAGEIISFADEIREAGFKDVVLLGMGGSSLAPEVLRRTFEPSVSAASPKLTVLDSTDPCAVLRVTEKINPAKTLFLFSSKSGNTIEPLSHFNYFYDLVSKTGGSPAGNNFIAITDPGSPLVSLAEKFKFRRVFLNPSDIGGRYSALSYFGLVPAALAGIEIRPLIEEASVMGAECGPELNEINNSAFVLGAALSALAKIGVNKLTFFISDEFASLGLWLEQLIAESTGKNGMGIVPLAGESPGDTRSYPEDRVFVHIGTAFVDEHHLEFLHYIQELGHPLISICINDPAEIAGEFLRWEIATAVSGIGLGINPFDQPDVESAKQNAKAMLLNASDGMRLRAGRVFKDDETKVRLYFDNDNLEKLSLPMHLADDVAGMKTSLKAFLGLLGKGDYVGLLAYFDDGDEELSESFSSIRGIIRDNLGVATQLGFGPRYLHSTGQLHKGGDDSGLFFIFFHSKSTSGKFLIPGTSYSFLDLESSQALGDLGALQTKRRRVALINLDLPFAESIKVFQDVLGDAVSELKAGS